MEAMHTRPHDDPAWLRAGRWLASPGSIEGIADLGLLGVPASASSITPSCAHTTPAAVREALMSYSTWSAGAGLDVGRLRAIDFGDVEDPDGASGHARVIAAAAAAASRSRLLIALGGDNSVTFPLAAGVLGTDDLAGCGLVTLDAHHDLRDGESNGSPVRRLIEAGLPGTSVVQIGIADFSNSPEYAARAAGLGVVVIPRSRLRREEPADVVRTALAIAGAGGRPIYVDIDVDVCDRSVVPGCPSAAPGGLTADELREMAFLLAADPRVRAIDITEIDASIDTPDRRTVRLAALLILEAAAGLCSRRELD